MSSQPAPRVLSLFKTPVLSMPVSEAANLNPALREVILARRAADSGVSLSNVLGWQSDKGLPDWGGAAAQRLRTIVVDQCEQITVDLRAEGKRR